MNWLLLFPFLGWPRPTLSTLARDALAGVTVGLVLVPQALAYASLAGMPPVTGLYAALLPGLIGVLWGSLRVLAVGPVALTSLLTFAALQPLAEPGSERWVQLAIWLAVYSGLVQLAIGALRFGAITNFVSNAVVSGFINAAALIIIVSQLPSLLGLPSQLDGQWWQRVRSVLDEAPVLVAATAGLGLAAAVLLRLQSRYLPRVPGVLLVCVLAIIVSAAIGFADLGGAVVGYVPPGLPEFVWLPGLSLEEHRALLPAAVVIALISFTEAMSSCRVLSRKLGEPWDIDQELIGQGLAKIASGFSGAFPVSGSFSRSALNVHAGAVSGWSALFAAACLVVCLLWLTEYLYHLPRAILAAIIIVPVLQLLDFGVFRRLWRASRDDGIVALITLVATLASAPHLHWGVVAGFTSAMFFYLYRAANPRVIELGLDAKAKTLRDREKHGLPPIADDVLAVRMDSSLTYITAPLLEKFLKERLEHRPGTRIVLLVASPANMIDSTGMDILYHLNSELRAQGIELHLSGLKLQVREALARANLLAELASGALYANNREAIERLTQRSQPAAE